MRELERYVEGDGVSKDYREIFFQEYAERAYNIALRVVGSEADASDVVATSFLRLFKRFKVDKNYRSLASYLFKVVYNLSVDVLRRREKELDVEMSVLESEIPVPEEVIENREMYRMLEKALAELPLKYRLPLILFYKEEMSIKQISDIVGISEGAVKTRLGRGRIMLRKKMEVYLEG